MNTPVAHPFITGAGLGLRRSMLSEISAGVSPSADFLEVAPENWIGIGGRFGRRFRELTERYAFVAHGLSLSLGGPAPLDQNLLLSVRNFLREHNILAYSEHLSYCSDEGHLYDLLPIPMTDSAARYTAERICRVQDVIGQRLIVENVSTYAEPGKEMNETDFLKRIVELSDCDILLDVNNVYVNSVNHGSDPHSMIRELPTHKIRYLHVAGHYDESADLLIDTHGASVKQDVWNLLQFAYQVHGVKPTLLERDFNIPPLQELEQELQQIRRLQQSVEAIERHYA